MISNCISAREVKDLVSKALLDSLKMPIHQQEIHVEVKEKEVQCHCYVKNFKLISSFRLTEMPGCCSYLISHYTFIDEDFRHLGLAQALQEVKLHIAKKADYSFLLCTVQTSNEPQNHILRKHGWKRIHFGYNKRTTNMVAIWTKKVE